MIASLDFGSGLAGLWLSGPDGIIAICLAVLYRNSYGLAITLRLRFIVSGFPFRFRSMPMFSRLSACLLSSLALAACGSASGPELRASKPVIYVSTQRTPADVASCLEERLPSVSASRVGGASELTVGSNAWLVTLTPSGYGSIVKVQKSDGDYGRLPEPEMRFDIARCTT
jgi:hypothetical protein